MTGFFLGKAPIESLELSVFQRLSHETEPLAAPRFDQAGHEQPVDRAARLGYPALALVDADGVYGAPRFYKAATKAGVRAIVGAELTIVNLNNGRSINCTNVFAVMLPAGADVVIHSGTKYLNGHHDAMCGVVAGTEPYIQEVLAKMMVWGQAPDPFAAWLLERGISSISLNPDTVVETWLNLAQRHA